jgi:hypothetical protein
VLEVAVIVTIVAAAALVLAYRPVGEADVRQWAKARGLELTGENRPMVARYLRRARLLRTWGAIAGLLSPTVLRALLGEPVHVAGVGANGMAPGELGLVFVGYLVGAVAAEVSTARPFDPARRSAALLPRELTDYLPRGVVQAQRGLAADDAIRAHSVHSLAGAGLAFLLFALGLVTAVLAASDLELLRRTMWLPTIVLVVLAVVVFRYYGERAWQVRRGMA